MLFSLQRVGLQCSVGFFSSYHKFEQGDFSLQYHSPGCLPRSLSFAKQACWSGLRSREVDQAPMLLVFLFSQAGVIISPMSEFVRSKIISLRQVASGKCTAALIVAQHPLCSPGHLNIGFFFMIFVGIQEFSSRLTTFSRNRSSQVQLNWAQFYH